MPGDKIHVRWVQTLQFKVHNSSETKISYKNSIGIASRLLIDDKPSYKCYSEKPKAMAPLWAIYNFSQSNTIYQSGVIFIISQFA